MDFDDICDMISSILLCQKGNGREFMYYKALVRSLKDDFNVDVYEACREHNFGGPMSFFRKLGYDVDWDGNVSSNVEPSNPACASLVRLMSLTKKKPKRNPGMSSNYTGRGMMADWPVAHPNQFTQSAPNYTATPNYTTTLNNDWDDSTPDHSPDEWQTCDVRREPQLSTYEDGTKAAQPTYSEADRDFNYDSTTTIPRTDSVNISQNHVAFNDYAETEVSRVVEAAPNCSEMSQPVIQPTQPQIVNYPFQLEAPAIHEAAVHEAEPPIVNNPAQVEVFQNTVQVAPVSIAPNVPQCESRAASLVRSEGDSIGTYLDSLVDIRVRLRKALELIHKFLKIHPNAPSEVYVGKCYIYCNGDELPARVIVRRTLNDVAVVSFIDEHRIATIKCNLLHEYRPFFPSVVFSWPVTIRD